MTQLYLLPLEEREIFFDYVAAELGLPFAMIEKDYWVVWILDRLFLLENLGPHLTFKGGTSLSKIYRVIQRFSEDIDVSIEKEFFGFHDNNIPEKASSRKKQQAALDNLSRACSEYITHNLFKTLTEKIADKLPHTQNWSLEIDSTDRTHQTLLFNYPTMIKMTGYIRPSVKIELGARSEHWPVSQYEVQSYAKQILKEKIDDDAVLVKVLEAQRTFWEKATILHQYAHFPKNKTLPPRISRHYYDFYCLLYSRIKTEAIHNQNLLEKVAFHKSIYFASAWASYETAKKGSLQLLPSPLIQKELEKDYHLMRDMLFGEIPPWNDILREIKNFENTFNQS